MKQKKSSDRYGRFSETLEQLQQQHLHRKLHVEEQKVLFSSNDYLALSKHPKVISAAKQALETWGFGSGSARTFSSHLPFYHTCEELLANTLQTEKSLLFSSGYQLNSTLLKALANENTLFFLDKYCHRSLLEGALNSAGKVFRFRHNDPEHLQDLLKKHRGEGQEAWIVTESLFSMHGTRGAIAELIELKNRYDTFLLVDIAHTLGITTPPSSSIDLLVGGFGKALGGFGGFVAGNSILIDYILNTSPGFLFTTALPPAIVAGLTEGLRILPELDSERAKLFNNASLLREKLSLPPGDYIVPYPVASPEVALSLSQSLRDAGFQVPAVRPPTVPPNGSLLRFSVTSAHTPDQIEAVTKHLLNSR